MSKSRAIVPFEFESQQVRTLTIDGEPWFVAKDVCAILEIADHHQAVASLDDDERGRYTVPTPSGKQRMAAVSESGLYSLIFRSRKPEAKLFRRWVTSEVLPSIRKTGSYIIVRDAIWQEQRQQGKLARREVTDTISRFIEYAKAFGVNKTRRAMI